MARRCVLIVCLLAATLVSGCERKTPSPSSQPADFEVVLDTPEDTVRTFITTMRHAIDTRAQGDREQASRYRRLVAQNLMDREQLRQSTLLVKRSQIEQDDYLGKLAEGWHRIGSYYVHGAALDQLRRTDAGADPASAKIELSAAGAADTATFGFELHRCRDLKWRVVHFGYVYPKGAVKRPPSPEG